MTPDPNELLPIGGAAAVLVVVLVIHEVVALRLLSRSLLPGVFALFAPLPIAICALCLPALIALWLAVFESHHPHAGADLIHQIPDTIRDVATSDGGQLAWSGSMLLAVLPIVLSILAHLGATPRRQGLDDLTPDDGQ